MTEKKCVILSFGFDSSVVLRAYSKYNLGGGDSLGLVVSKEENTRREAAIKEVESFLSSLRSRGVDIDLSVLRVEAGNIEAIVTQVADFITQEGYSYYLEATGGLRSVCVALTILGILLKNHISDFHTIDDSNGKIVRVPLPYSGYELSDTKKKILSLIKSLREVKTRDIAKSMDKNISTINRHLGEMEKNLLIERDSRYNAVYRLTYIGEVSLKG